MSVTLCQPNVNQDVAAAAAKRARGGVRSGPDDARKVWHIRVKAPTNRCLFLECCGYKITPTARPGGSMQITHHKEHGLRLPALMRSKPVLFSALIIGLLPVQLFA